MRPITLEGRPLHIFPCRADKRPTCPHGFKDAVADQEGIARLWSLCPGPLIGVPTGAISGIVAIDIDLRRGGDRWFHENRDRLPKTRTHETPSGGWHLIFNYLPGLRTSSDKIASGVEVRANGPHIIWWPAHAGRVTAKKNHRSQTARSLPPCIIITFRPRKIIRSLVVTNLS